MKRFSVYWRRLAIGAWVVVSWAAMQTTVWAQPGKNEEEAPQYVLPYALVIFGIALGLMMLFSPSRRRDKAKIDPLEERKAKKGEKAKE